MSDQTTARDRAIEQAEEIVASDYAHDEASPELPWAAYTLMNEAKRLRALVGAPTADLDALSARFRAAEDRCCDLSDAATLGIAPLLGQIARRLEGQPDFVVEAIGRALAGAPTADVAALLRVLDEIDSAPAEWALARELPVDEIRRLLADPAVEPEGMDVEAQGEMADELDEAQAANERVRALADEMHDVIHAAAHAPDSTWGSVADYVAAQVRRAVDGDTTEEQR